MLRTLTRVVMGTGLFVSVGLAGCGGDPCTSADVAARLMAATPGSTVDVSACRVLEGPLVVPAGVTLRGSDTEVRGGASAAVTLRTTSGSTTTLVGVDVLGRYVGVRTEGDGAAAIDGSEIVVERGVGAVLLAMRSELIGVRITGDVTYANRDDSRWLSASSADSASHGVVIGRGTVGISGATITGFSWAAVSAGAEVIEGGGPIDLTLTESTLGSGLGVGLSSSAATLVLTDVRIENVWTGVRGWPSYAALWIDGDVTTSALAVTDVDGFGIVQIAGASDQTALVIEHTGDVGAWFGTDVSAQIGGEGTRIVDTGFAGVLAVDATELFVRDGAIEGVRAERRTVGPSGAIEVGDGIGAIGTPLTLDGVTLSGAARVGLLVDSLAASTLRDVVVTSEGAGLGAVQGTIDRAAEDFTAGALPGWDSGITRMGTAAINDAAFTGTLPVVVAPGPPSTRDALGVIAPMY